MSNTEDMEEISRPERRPMQAKEPSMYRTEIYEDIERRLQGRCKDVRGWKRLSIALSTPSSVTAYNGERRKRGDVLLYPSCQCEYQGVFREGKRKEGNSVLALFRFHTFQIQWILA